MKVKITNTWLIIQVTFLCVMVGLVFSGCPGSTNPMTQSTNDGTPPEPVVELIDIDLVVDVTVSDLSLFTGESLILTAIVSNKGITNTTNTTFLRWYLSTNQVVGSGDTGLGSNIISNLNAGGSESKSLTVTALDVANTYYYGACVDSVVGESNMSNNCSSIRVIVGNPDLVVGNVMVSDNNPYFGKSLSLTTVVSNSGIINANPTTLRWYQSSDQVIDTTDTELSTDAVVSIAGGGSQNESFDVSAPATIGTYFYGVCVETVNSEINTNNNCSTGTMIVVGNSELTVFDVTVSTNEDFNGADITLTAVVSNSGSLTAEAPTLTWYRSVNSTIDTSDAEVGTDAVAALTSGADGSETIDITLSVIGSNYYGACVEAVGGELDTNDNCSMGVLVVVLANEFNALAEGNTAPTGIWSDGTTMWVANDNSTASVFEKVFAYDLRTKAYDSNRDFDLHPSNRSPQGIWSDGINMWIANGDSPSGVYVYDLANKTAMTNRTFNLNINNFLAADIWSDGTTLWVVNRSAINNNIYAYNLMDGAYNSNQNFNDIFLTNSGNNTGPVGIWSDGTTVWVSTPSAFSGVDVFSILAYDQASKARDSSQDFSSSTFAAAGNTDGSHIWSDGTTMWVLDKSDRKIYAYNLATKQRTP